MQDPATSIELFEKTGQGERAGELHVAQALQLIRGAFHVENRVVVHTDIKLK